MRLQGFERRQDSPRPTTTDHAPSGAVPACSQTGHACAQAAALRPSFTCRGHASHRSAAASAGRCPTATHTTAQMIWRVHPIAVLLLLHFCLWICLCFWHGWLLCGLVHTCTCMRLLPVLQPFENYCCFMNPIKLFFSNVSVAWDLTCGQCLLSCPVLRGPVLRGAA